MWIFTNTSSKLIFISFQVQYNSRVNLNRHRQGFSSRWHHGDNDNYSLYPVSIVRSNKNFMVFNDHENIFHWNKLVTVGRPWCQFRHQIKQIRNKSRNWKKSDMRSKTFHFIDIIITSVETVTIRVGQRNDPDRISPTNAWYMIVTEIIWKTANF